MTGQQRGRSTSRLVHWVGRTIRVAPLVRVAVAAAAVTTTVAVAHPAGAWSREPIRVAGDDRYDTAARLSQAAFPSGAPVAIVVSGEAFPDGLVAGPLSALQGGPILLTPSDGLTPTTVAELTRLHPASVEVIGGSSAVSDAALAQITAATGVTATRIAGPTRYATAAAVAALFPAHPSTAFVATGASFPDALAGGAAAAMVKAPMLLAEPDKLSAPTVAQLTRLQPAALVVLGGTGAVSDAVLQQLRPMAPSVGRIAGTDRYATAALVAANRVPTARQALLATGNTFADALAAAPLAARLGAPILLTAFSCAPSGTLDALRFLHWPDLTVVGGPLAVSASARAAVPCRTPPDGEVAPGVTMATRLLPGPRVAHVVTVDERRGVELRTTTAAGALTGRLATTSIARQWDALVAVNGDFFLPTGEPVHAFASGGRLMKAPGLQESMVGFDSRAPNANYEGVQQFSMTAELPSGPLTVNRVNDGAPSDAEVALFTAEASRRVDLGGPACSATLTVVGPASIAPSGDTNQEYTVGAAACGGGEVTPAGNDVLTALVSNPQSPLIGALTPGSTVNFHWRINPTWSAVLDATGVNLPLVSDGAVAPEILVGTVPFFRERAPRTAIGWLADGQELLVTVDGRQDGYSIGMTPRELSDFMLSLGAVSAANLDGGGSTAMAVRGVLVNRPSDAAGERAVGTALVVVPTGAQPTRTAPPPPPATGSAAEPAQAAVAPADPATDSASLGGWSAAQVEQGRPVPPPVRQAAQRFVANEAGEP
ncbi:MAG: hypothetical protein JWL70_2954 [Acidimicrobiia bacterium]|nr:hypothetical protein [Acidimicrobiia bacterium]